MPSADPRTIYEEHLARHRQQAAEAERAADRIADLRLVAFLALLAALGAAFFSDVTVHLVWLPLVAFVWLVLKHGRATETRLRAERAIRFHEAGVRRLDGTWPGTGRQGDGLVPDGHLYAPDLDLTGEGSLFELLCTARTAVGEQRLADWLLAPAAADVIQARQPAVRELAGRLTFRETMAVEEGDVARAMERGAAEAWGAAPRRLAGVLEPWLHAVAALATTVSLIGWGFYDTPGWPLLLSMVVQYALATRRRETVTEVLEAANRPAQDLALVGRLLEHLERTEFESPHLQSRIGRLTIEGVPPSQRIRSLSRLMDLVDARHNQVFLPLSFLLSLGTQL
ncbi:MAG: DNA mismatch repair protein MutS, partial [Planctomycetota bacterium]|nr:DNA mismatch repair protein MutS [Planctomycetota bacterium]